MGEKGREYRNMKCQRKNVSGRILQLVRVDRGFPGDARGKQPSLPVQETQETQVRSLGWEDPLEEGTVIHSSILAWRIPWTEEPGVHGDVQSWTQLK